MDNIDCTGSCLCGAIRFRVTGKAVRFTLCHCGRCRKATGSANSSNIGLADGRLDWIQGETLVYRYKMPEPARYATAFCGHCGSPLPRHIPEIGMIVVPAGSLDENPGISPEAHIFWASHAKWLEPDTELPKYKEIGPLSVT